MLRWIESIQTGLLKIEAGVSARVDFFLRQVLHAVVSIQNFIYGEKVLSWRAMTVSLSLCSLLYLVWIRSELKSWMVVCCLLGIALVYPTLLRRRVALYGILSGIAITGALWMMSRDFVLAFRGIHPYLLHARSYSASMGLPPGYFGAMSYFARAVSAPFMILASAIVDYISVFATRRCFKRAEIVPGLLQSLKWICLATMVAPLTIAVLVSGTLFAETLLRGSFIDPLWVAFGTVVLSAIAILMSLGVVTLLCLTVLSRAVLAITPRLVNSVVKVDLNSHRRTALAVGLLLVGLSQPRLTEWIEKVLKPLFG